MNFNSIRSWSVAAALMIALLAPITAWAHIPSPPKKNEIGRRVVKKPVSDFVLTDQSGKSFRLADQRGKVIAVTFIYTRCPDVCPLLSARFAAMNRSLAGKKTSDYLFVSITTDPQHDTTKNLAAYAKLFGAEKSRWVFLTGSQQTLQRVWKDFGVTVTRLPGDEIQHTELTTLIDGRGLRRVDYYGDQWQEKQVLKDIDSLAARNQPAD
jgi:protein SCO1/2